jgi:uncharacterized protein (TIGR00369 family)
MTGELLEQMRRINEAFMQLVPHNRALGLVFERFARAEAVVTLPYDARLVGNPDTGVLHGGAISSLLDACCGAAVFMALDTPQPIATLDLRIDYLKPATAGSDVTAEAHCFKVTRNVAFVRAMAYHDAADPIAAAAGTFMLTHKGAWPSQS